MFLNSFYWTDTYNTTILINSFPLPFPISSSSIFSKMYLILLLLPINPPPRLVSLYFTFFFFTYYFFGLLCFFLYSNFSRFTIHPNLTIFWGLLLIFSNLHINPVYYFFQFRIFIGLRDSLLLWTSACFPSCNRMKPPERYEWIPLSALISV